MSIQVVELHPSDWERYKVLRLRSLKDDPQAFSSTYAESVQRTDDWWSKRLEDAEKKEREWLLFAEENGNLVGMVGAFLTEENIANIISVYVVKEARGKGISKQLMNDLLKRIQVIKNIKYVRLTVNSGQIPAHRLYESVGFSVIGEETKQLGDGKTYLEYLMEKEFVK